jgi:hypothetical protein
VSPQLRDLLVREKLPHDIVAVALVLGQFLLAKLVTVHGDRGDLPLRRPPKNVTACPAIACGDPPQQARTKPPASRASIASRLPLL